MANPYEIANVFGSGAQGFIKGMQDAENIKMKKMEMEALQKARDDEFERNKLIDAINMRKSGLMKNEAGEFVDTPEAIQERDLDRKIKEAQLGKIRSEATATGKGTKLGADKVLLVQQGATIPNQLKDIESLISENADVFDPIRGQARLKDPYDTQAQTVNSQISASAQAFGRYMEGGVLRKEDEEKYKKMFPAVGDTPQVAKNKLKVVNRLLTQKQNADISALKSAGYDTSPFQMLEEGEAPAVSAQSRGGILKGLLSGIGLLGNTAAADSPSLVRKKPLESMSDKELEDYVKSLKGK